jgi:hypothetical protein
MRWEVRVSDPRVDELLKQARRADKIDRERIEVFEMLVKTRGWQTFVEILDAKIQLFADQVMSPAGTRDGLVALEYVKGAMSGLIMARDIPSVTIAAKPDLRQPVIEDGDSDEDVD